jgi:hypothetical protein
MLSDFFEINLSGLPKGIVMISLYITFLVIASGERDHLFGEEPNRFDFLIGLMVAAVISVLWFFDTTAVNHFPPIKTALDLFFLRLGMIILGRGKTGRWFEFDDVLNEEESDDD